MTEEKIKEQMSALLADEKFISELCKVRTAEEVAAIFTANAVPMTVADAQQIMDFATQKEELDENTLDNVSGGIVWTSVYLACFAIGAGAGLAHGAYKELKKHWS